VEIIDTHAHLYSAEFDSDRDAMIERAVKAGLTKIVMPNIDSESIEGMMALTEKYPELCRPSMGLHPCSVQPETWEAELDLCYSWLKKHPFVAIGECGMDLYWDQSTKEIQAEALDIQCSWALEFDLPMIIHSRNATPECIEIIRPWAKKGVLGVFHCFSGTLEEAMEITAMGWYLGIGGVITFKKSDLGSVAKQVDAKYLLLETDAPYLAPVPYRGKRNESSYLAYVNETLGEHLLAGRREIAKTTTENAKRLFSGL
jgi:TatD DNase family protein